MNITKSDLVDQMKERYGYTKKSASALIDDFCDVIVYNMEQGNSVSLRNFGCFDQILRKEHGCPNPKTGEHIVIPAHWIPRFYPGTAMRRATKIWEDNEKRGLN